MSLERVRCTLCDVRSGKSVSTSLAIHQSMITNIRIWCTKHPGQMELFMNRERIEDVQKDVLQTYDFEPVFITGDGKQTLLSSHDKISSYLKTLDIPYSPDGGLILYVRILRGSSGRKRVLFGPVREAVAAAHTSRRLTRPVSDGQGGEVWPGQAAYHSAGPSAPGESPLEKIRRTAKELLEEAGKLFQTNRKLLRRFSFPAALLALYLFFCLIARPGLMQALYASGRYGGEVFLYNATSSWCLPGQKGITLLAEQQIDALYVQASPYERNASKSLIKLTAFKSISDDRLARKASLYTDQLSACLKDLDLIEKARDCFESGRYTDVILSLRDLPGDSLVISAAEDLRYDAYDRMTAGAASPKTKEDCEEALRYLDTYLAALGEDQTLQWTRDETAKKYESLVLEEAEDLTEGGYYDDAEALLARASDFDKSDTILSLLDRIRSRQREDFIIASSCTAFSGGSVSEAEALIREGLEEYPDSERLSAVLDCYRSYKKISFQNLLFRVPQGLSRKSFVLPGGKELDDCLVFGKFSEKSTVDSLSVTASPAGRYQVLEGTIYAGKHLEADGRIEISGDGLLLYDSGRIYRPSDPAKDKGVHFSIAVEGIDKVTVRAYIYKKPSLSEEEGIRKAEDDARLCTLVLDDLTFHDDLTEEMIWAAADLEEEE